MFSPNNTITFTLLEATLNLYATNADGTLGATVWSGAPAENFRAVEKWLNVETRQTGQRHPKQHPLVAQYEISIERVLALPLSTLNGFQPTEQPYILEVLWTEEDTQQWHRRTFYGVTISSRTLAARGIENGTGDDQEFLAQYFIVDSGQSGTPPAPVQVTPMVVQWVDNTGALVLYTYAGGVFTAAADTTGRGTIAADGSVINVSGTDILTTASTGIAVASLHDVFPLTLPRLEFYYGLQLVAVLDAAGIWARSFGDGTLPGSAAGQFILKSGANPVAVLAPGLATALSITA